MSVKKSMKKMLIAVIFMLAISASVTFAFMSNVTESVTNVFASEKNIALELREPKWDGYTFDDLYPTNVTPGTEVKPNTTDCGLLKANNYHPGDVIAKNPMVKNTSRDVKEWIAIKVQYIDDNGNAVSKETFNSKYAKTAYGDKEFNEAYTNIVDENKNYELYMYNTDLATEASTEALFSSVIVNKTLQANSNNKWPTFSIKVTGYAVQSDGVSQDTAKEALVKLANEQ